MSSNTDCICGHSFEDHRATCIRCAEETGRGCIYLRKTKKKQVEEKPNDQG